MDVDREPRKEHNFFHIPFHLKDVSDDTSKRLLQDLSEYCLRNQRTQTAREAERVAREVEITKKHAEERQNTLRENGLQLKVFV